MTADLVFHYPADVFEATVDAVLVPAPGKRDVVTYFRGSGADRAFVAGIENRVVGELGNALQDKDTSCDRIPVQPADGQAR